ncbi:MAG: hypothetical protein JWN75_1183 [Candidatus Saccharibacteria bacterium]|nr:hypothetical protein [Candidatus Saccharibacteria bacterium]
MSTSSDTSPFVVGAEVAFIRRYQSKVSYTKTTVSKVTPTGKFRIKADEEKLYTPRRSINTVRGTDTWTASPPWDRGAFTHRWIYTIEMWTPEIEAKIVELREANSLAKYATDLRTRIADLKLTRYQIEMINNILDKREDDAAEDAARG